MAFPGPGPDFIFASPDNELTASRARCIRCRLLANGFAARDLIARRPPPPLYGTPLGDTIVSGAAFSVSAGGPVGDYLFNAHGVGSDANTDHP